MERLTDPVILCCGEAVADLVPAELADGGTGFRPVPGGAAVNTAVALARLGTPSGFVGTLSTDPMGTMLRTHLYTEGVNLNGAVSSDASATVALAHPLADGTRFDLYDEGTAGRALQRGMLPPLPQSVQALVFGGISLIHAPGADEFEALAASNDDRLIWLDLNIRGGLVSDPGPYRARLERMAKLADVIKVSDEDLEWLGPLPPLRDNQLLLQTCGAQGAKAKLGAIDFAVPAPVRDVRDTVGAGDIFNAGFLSFLYRNGLLNTPLKLNEQALTDAVSFGITAASISVTRSGADAPTTEEVLCAQ